MRRRIEKDDWSYIYEDTQKCIYEYYCPLNIEILIPTH